MLLLVLRLMIQLFIPEVGIWIHVFGNEVVYSKHLITLALWCIWFPALVVSIFALYQRRSIRGTSGVGREDKSALRTSKSI